MRDDLTNETLVIYLAFADFGSDALSCFLSSYREYTAGHSHRLLIACKNYGETLPDFVALGAPADAIIARVPNRGYDLGTYRHVAEHFPAQRYCFFNSRSIILHQNWLALLENAISNPKVGAAGATGSFQSLLTDHLDIHRHATQGSTLRKLIRRSAINTLRHRWRFPPFPNPHLRTNALLIDRDLLLRVWPRRFRAKLDTAQFENGRRSLTRRLERLGLSVVVVGRDGIYGQAEWPLSNTFWSGEQTNLLVTDNQTSRFAEADDSERQLLSFSAWHACDGKRRLI